MQHAATRCNMLQHAATRYNTLQHTVKHYLQWASPSRTNVTPNDAKWETARSKHEQHTATHSNTLQHTATRCNTLQRPSYDKRLPVQKMGNTLQHAATRCNTLQHSSHQMSASLFKKCARPFIPLEPHSLILARAPFTRIGSRGLDPIEPHSLIWASRSSRAPFTHMSRSPSHNLLTHITRASLISPTHTSLSPHTRLSLSRILLSLKNFILSHELTLPTHITRESNITHTHFTLPTHERNS